MLTKFILGTLSTASLAQAQQMVADPTYACDGTRPPCEQQPFCDRFRQWLDYPDLRASSDVYYSVDKTTLDIQEKQGVISAKLNLASQSDGSIAQTLDLTLSVYQNGIVRMLIEESGVSRFRISQEDLPVVDGQLVAQDLTGIVSTFDNDLTIDNLWSVDGDEGWQLDLVFDRFRLHHKVKQTSEASYRTMTVNDDDTLWFETV